MPILTAVITCPLCAARAIEAMPEDACLRYYQCTSCGHTLTPRGRDCCVFCSYADTRCPPKTRYAHLALPDRDSGLRTSAKSLGWSHG